MKKKTQLTLKVLGGIALAAIFTFNAMNFIGKPDQSDSSLLSLKTALGATENQPPPEMMIPVAVPYYNCPPEIEIEVTPPVIEVRPLSSFPPPYSTDPFYKVVGRKFEYPLHYEWEVFKTGSGTNTVWYARHVGEVEVEVTVTPVGGTQTYCANVTYEASCTTGIECE